MDEQVDRLVKKTWGMWIEMNLLLINTPARPLGLTGWYQANANTKTHSYLLPFLMNHRLTISSPPSSQILFHPSNARLMIAVSGIPGSGKTELASTMSHRINQLHASENPSSSTSCRTPIATSLPMDGYHLTRAQLSALPNPTQAFARRGAAFTFDPYKFLHLVRALREPLTPSTKPIYAPSFDHAVKDPVEDDIAIDPGVRVIFFEGNYLSLNKEPWDEVASLMDELWFVDVDFEVARKRLVRRHVKAGIAGDEVQADIRARENDLVNGREIVEFRLPVQEVVSSIHDPAWERL